MKLLPAFLLTVGLCLAATLNLGGPLTLTQPDPVDKIASAPAAYVGKTIQVKGKITEVCQMMGCWMNLADPETGKLLKIKVDDGDIVFPKDSIGKLAIAEARHEAEEQRRKFNPASVKSGATVYQIQCTGATILEAGYVLDSGNCSGNRSVRRSPWTARDAFVPLPEAEAGSPHGREMLLDRTHLSQAHAQLLE